MVTKLFVGCLAATLAAHSSRGMTISVAGSVGDLDGDGSSVAEDALFSSVASRIGDSFDSDRSFTWTVSASDASGALGWGEASALDLLGRPTAGYSVFSRSIGAYAWWVDATPDDNSEYALCPDATEVTQVYCPLPEMFDWNAIDLRTTAEHELFHALVLSLQNPNLVDRIHWYDYVPYLQTADGAQLPMDDDLVHFRTGDGYPISLLSSNRHKTEGYRYEFGTREVAVMEAVNGDTQFLATPGAVETPEPVPGLLFAGGCLLLLFCALKKRV